MLSRASQVCPSDKSLWQSPIINYDPELVADIDKYIRSIRNFREVQPMQRHLLEYHDQLQEINVFSDGSLAFAGFLIYFVVKQDRKKVLKLVRASSKTQNCSVPVSEHVSRSLGFDGWHAILSVLHAHFSNLPVQFTFITDSLCTSKLFREGISTTVKLASNTRLQKEHAEQLSLSFPLGKVRFIWVPSALNLSDCMTNVSRDPIKLVNSGKYRPGQLRPDLCYLDLLQANCFFECTKGQSVYTDLDFSQLVTGKTKQDQLIRQSLDTLKNCLQIINMRDFCLMSRSAWPV